MAALRDKEAQVLNDLLEKVKHHSGEFLCEGIGNRDSTKTVPFIHQIEPPQVGLDVPNVGDLQDFYKSFGSLIMYVDEASFDAALMVAAPSEWPRLESEFSDWTDMVDDEEEDVFPGWFGSHRVIGEIPGTGNYVLAVTDGDEAGSIYVFDHDGFEFSKLGQNLESAILAMLQPDESIFIEMASHMRFISGDSMQQWWAKELRDNTGHVVRNDL